MAVREEKSLNRSHADSAGALARLESGVPDILRPPLLVLCHSVNAQCDSPSCSLSCSILDISRRAEHRDRYGS
jgi:hypothetical protein